MCGIAGFVTKNKNFDYNTILTNMGLALIQRGPDDCGVWYDTVKGVGLSHRRLSIQDLSPMGHQPMMSSNQRYLIVFNGEIYNHWEIREKELPAFKFKTSSDTETLLALYIKYKEKCVNFLKLKLCIYKNKKSFSKKIFKKIK
jgi:asparagine synthase (glutamine-hydrolysing)